MLVGYSAARCQHLVNSLASVFTPAFREMRMIPGAYSEFPIFTSVTVWAESSADHLLVRE
jgi:hypothetical protein